MKRKTMGWAVEYEEFEDSDSGGAWAKNVEYYKKKSYADALVESLAEAPVYRNISRPIRLVAAERGE